MRILRLSLLTLFCLLPLATLVHRGDAGHWDVQRSAMAGPDEFSYLLMAANFLRGGGLSLQHAIGRDTFYPPGFPLLLAGWTKVFFGGHLTAFAAHALNAVLLCVDTLVAYLFTRRILDGLPGDHRRFRAGGGEGGAGELRAWLALLAAGVFASNWHVLETSLLIMSEPAFMLATFAWLALGLRWSGNAALDWTLDPRRAWLLAVLAIAAWSIRGAGIVCVAATLLYPLLRMVVLRRESTAAATARRLAAFVVVLVLALGYQVTLAHFSPEKSVASGEESANSYPRQLLHGITDGDRLHLGRIADYPGIGANFGKLVLAHFNDYASCFVPWPRENPDFHFRDIAGKCVGLLGLLGWLWHATRRRVADGRRDGEGGRRFLDVFLLLYFALYLVWPFDFARFWIPILPVMLVFAADAVVRFSPTFARLRPGAGGIGGAALLALLLVLSLEEVALQLGHYARRLNYVSDALAQAVHTIVKRSPDPRQTSIVVLGGDDHFAVAWYLSQDPEARAADARSGKGYRPLSPAPHVPAKGGAAETPLELLQRALRGPDNAPAGAATATVEPAPAPGYRVYLLSYFENVDAASLVTNSKARDAVGWTVERVFQKEIVAGVWEFRSAHTAATGDADHGGAGSKSSQQIFGGNPPRAGAPPGR